MQVKTLDLKGQELTTEGPQWNQISNDWGKKKNVSIATEHYYKRFCCLVLSVLKNLSFGPLSLRKEIK